MPPFPPQGAGYLTLLSRHSLGNGTMVMLVLLSLRWGIKLELEILYYGSNQSYRYIPFPKSLTLL
ncbi:MAG: hypothetical protein WBI82_03145 [Sphaerochaeta sp.]